VTTDASFADCFVFEDKRAALSGVTLEAGVVFTEECGAAAFQSLLQIRPATFNGDADVWIVAIGATHFAFQHRVMMRQLEFCSHFEVALETGFGRATRINDLGSITSAADMQAAWPVTRFAADVLRVFAFCLQARMSRRSKIAGDGFVTGLATFGADKFGTGNLRRSKNRPIGVETTARK
jgi:hypothetical protein